MANLILSHGIQTNQVAFRSNLHTTFSGEWNTGGEHSGQMDQIDLVLMKY
jgi:hypothetical protein